MLTHSLQSHVKQPAPVYRQSPVVVKKGPSIARFRKRATPDKVVPVNSFNKRMRTGLCARLRVRVRVRVSVRVRAHLRVCTCLGTTRHAA